MPRGLTTSAYRARDWPELLPRQRERLRGKLRMAREQRLGQPLFQRRAGGNRRFGFSACRREFRLCRLLCQHRGGQPFFDLGAVQFGIGQGRVQRRLGCIQITVSHL